MLQGWHYPGSELSFVFVGTSSMLEMSMGKASNKPVAVVGPTRLRTQMRPEARKQTQKRLVASSECCIARETCLELLHVFFLRNTPSNPTKDTPKGLLSCWTCSEMGGRRGCFSMRAGPASF